MGGGGPVVHDVIPDVQPIQIHAMSSIAPVGGAGVVMSLAQAQKLYIHVMHVGEEVVAVPVIVPWSGAYHVRGSAFALGVGGLAGRRVLSMFLWSSSWPTSTLKREKKNQRQIMF